MRSPRIVAFLVVLIAGVLVDAIIFKDARVMGEIVEVDANSLRIRHTRYVMFIDISSQLETLEISKIAQSIYPLRPEVWLIGYTKSPLFINVSGGGNLISSVWLINNLLESPSFTQLERTEMVKEFLEKMHRLRPDQLRKWVSEKLRSYSYQPSEN